MAIKGQNVYGMSGADVAAWISENSPFYAEFSDSVVKLYTDESKESQLCSFSLTTYSTTLYYNNGESTVSANSISTIAISSAYIYLCNNGIIIDKRGSSTRQYSPVMIAKNTDGVCSILYSTDTTANSNVAYYTNLHSVSYVGNTIADFGFTPINIESTALTNVCYHGEIGKKNCMENGYISLFYQYNSAGILMIDGEEYVTNGYWCIKD